MESLNEKELLLSLSEQLHTLFVVPDDHRGKDLVPFPLGSNFEVAAALLLFLQTQVLGFDSELVVQFPALLEALNTVVGVSLDVFQQSVRSLSV